MPARSSFTFPTSPKRSEATRIIVHGARSEAVREGAIFALLTEKTIGAAAERCGVNERTLRRWMAHDESFKLALAEARRATYHAVRWWVHLKFTRINIGLTLPRNKIEENLQFLERDVLSAVLGEIPTRPLAARISGGCRCAQEISDDTQPICSTSKLRLPFAAR